ncbi:MAG: Hsp20/alpha crystallin family protein [Candidatus Paceibacterota bacterium]
MAQKELKKQNKRNGEKQSLSRSNSLPLGEIFDEFFNDEFMRNPWSLLRGTQVVEELEKRLFPRTDVSETDKEVKVVADVPGVDPDDIEIDVRGHRLVLSGSSERKHRSDEKPYTHERTYGEFRREFTLPSDVDEDRVQAVYEDGVLHITLPKVVHGKRKKIKIEKK